MGVGGRVVDGAVAAETHAEDVESVGVAFIVLENPVDDVVDSVGVPSTSRVLRGDDDGVDLTAHGEGVEGAVAAYPFEVASAKAGSVKKEDDGLVGLDRIVVFWGGDPKIIAVGNLVPISSKCLSRQ